MDLPAKGETGTSYMFVVKKITIPIPNKYVYSLVLTKNLIAVIETTLRRFD